jgi:hypothetical protein
MAVMALDPELTIAGHTPQQIRHGLIDRIAAVISDSGELAAPLIVDNVVLPYVGQLIRELAQPIGDDEHLALATYLRAEFDQLADEYETAGRWCRE